MPKIQSVNPSNYEILGEVEISTFEEIKQKVQLSKLAQKEWSFLSLEKRVEILRSALDDLKAKKDEFVLLESQEMGMVLTDAKLDFDAIMDYAYWYLNNSQKYLSPEISFESDTEIHQVIYEPIGVSAVIVPWNLPIVNLIWGTIQSLVAGNTVVLKHSEECILCAKFLDDIFTKQLPSNVFSQVYGDGKVGQSLIEQDVDMISFTGSTKTGKYLYEYAGKKFIKAVVELGGSAPGIVFQDADLDVAIENICFNRLFNQGQCCDALKRLIVHESIFEEVVTKIADIFKNKKIGSSQDPSTEIGPLVANRQVETLISQVEDAKNKGGNIVAGGNSLQSTLNGAYFEPTLITNISYNMRVWTEEVFGPVLPVVKFTTEAEAIALANDTSYGLGAYIYSQNQELTQRVAKQIQTGMISVNGISYLQPSNPFGGYKSSGIGRQHGKYGFQEVTQVKVIARQKK